MPTYKTGRIKRAMQISDMSVCLFCTDISLGVPFGISRTFLLIAGTDNNRSDKSNKKYNSKLFHNSLIILIYKNSLFIVKTMFMPKIIFIVTIWNIFESGKSEVRSQKSGV
jgi:hypothetical protein